MEDPIDSLPHDENAPELTPHQMQILDTLFASAKQNSGFARDTKEFILLVALFIIFSLSIVDVFVRKFVPFTRMGSIFVLAVKAIAFGIVYYIARNIAVARTP